VCSGFFFSESDMSYPGKILYYISLSRIGLSSNIYTCICIYIIIFTHTKYIYVKQTLLRVCMRNTNARAYV
jgi:hypothetical protein